MRFMLLQNYAATAVATVPLSSWAPEDARAHVETVEDVAVQNVQGARVVAQIQRRRN